MLIVAICSLVWCNCKAYTFECCSVGGSRDIAVLVWSVGRSCNLAWVV